MTRGELFDQSEHGMIEGEVAAPVLGESGPVIGVAGVRLNRAVKIGNWNAGSPVGVFGENLDLFKRGAGRASRRKPCVEYTVIVGDDDVAEIEDENVDIAQAAFSNRMALVRKALSSSTMARPASANKAGRSVWL